MAYSPNYTITPALFAEAERIAGLRERIQAATVDLGGTTALQRDARARCVQASAALDGIALTLAQVRAIDDGQVPQRADENAVAAVQGLFAVLRDVETNAGTASVTKAAVLDLHRLLLDGVADAGPAGRYRKSSDEAADDAPSADALTEAMRELLAWWNGDAAALSPVLVAAIVHERVLALQPFVNGNGRMARALATWALYRRGFDARFLFAVDEVYAEDAPSYAGALAAASEDNDLESDNPGDLAPWLEYSAEALRTAIERSWLRVQGLRGGANKKIALRPRQQQVLQLLRDRGTLEPHEVWAELGVSRQGALDTLKPLIAAGLIERVGGAKTGHYVLRKA